MANIIAITVIAIALFFGIRQMIKQFKGGGCHGGGSYKARKKKLNNVIKTKTFKVSGMHCDHCKARVEGAINDISGISGLVNLKKGELTVSYEKDVPDEVIAAQIEKNGYKIDSQE